MSTPILVFALLGAVMAVLAERRRKGLSVEGLRTGLRQMVGILPMIAVALVLAGMVEALIPDAFVKEWLSAEAGFRGVVLGVLGGILLAMGPYASYPIIVSVYGAGAGIGTTVSLLVSWSLLNLSRLPFEVGFLGLPFFLRRMVIGTLYCLLAGSVALIIETLI